MRDKLPNSPELPQAGGYNAFVPRFYTLWRMLGNKINELSDAIEDVTNNGNSSSDFGTYGRLTLESGVPLSGDDVTGASTIYWTPLNGNTLGLWNGSAWVQTAFTETSLALGTKTSGKNYDVFGYLSSGSLALEDLAWTNDSTRATAITLQDGRYCKSGDKTRLYLGTYRTTSTTTTEDSGRNTSPSVGGKRFLYNHYNQADRWIGVHEDSSWNYSTATWRQAAGNAGNQVECVVGTPAPYTASVHSYCTSTSAANVAVAIGVDQTTPPEWPGYGTGMPANAGLAVETDIGGILGAGYHYIAWLEIGFGSGTQTWYGISSPQIHSGLRAMVRM
jgi:hypothetical protein